MSIETTLSRVDAIRQALADPAQLVGKGGVGATGGTQTPSGPGAAPFPAAPAPASPPEARPAPRPAYGVALSAVPTGAYGTSSLTGLGSGAGGGGRVLSAAESQIGQSEQPPGSNESPAIAEYRTATAGAQPGEPWCAYFVSWAARQAG